MVVGFKSNTSYEKSIKFFHTKKVLSFELSTNLLKRFLKYLEEGID